MPDITERYQIFYGDLGEKDSEIRNESVDWLITDPPYSKDLNVYSDLASFAKMALKNRGSLICMVGQSYLPDIISALSEKLKYQWTLTYLTPGGQSEQIRDRKVNTFWKPLLWLTKGEYQGDWIGDVCKSDINNNKKRFHEWGPSESGMADIIEMFTNPGQTVLDPFMGGGTTGVVSIQLGRIFIGIEKDQASFNTAKERLANAAS